VKAGVRVDAAFHPNRVADEYSDAQYYLGALVAIGRSIGLGQVELQGTAMNANVGRPEIGQWYTRADKGQVFQVVGRDDASRTIEIQLFDGDLDEIEADTWNTLPLERSEQPEDWTGPVDDVEVDDLGYSATEMKPSDWVQPPQPLQVEPEGWENPEPEEERDVLGEGAPAEPFSADVPEATERGR